MNASFETAVPGKWVLSGEHAVLKGATALALPHPEFRLRLKFAPAAGSFVVNPAEAQPIVADVLAAIGVAEPDGRLEIDSTIPTGAGLGSSAALCVALTRWIAPSLGVAPEGFREFATRLEDRFHGKSSGMDVAVAQEGSPILYRMGHPIERLAFTKLPHFTFHDTGLRAKTQECVAQVERFRVENPQRGRALDAQMGEATQVILRGIAEFQRDSGSLSQIAQGMTLGSACFDEWGLKPSAISELERRLRLEGALATKLTGAGGGGMVVALWDDLHYKNKS